MTTTTTDRDRGRASPAGSRRSTRAHSTRAVFRLDELDAVCFDLDGVLTDTASLHRAAWTAAFNELFECLGADAGSAAHLEPFTSDDYRRLVDGAPRMDGVRHVLADRMIALPEGNPSDQTGFSSAWAIAALKDDHFSALLQERGPHVFRSSRGLLERLRAAGVSIGVVSASRHCKDVLARAGLDALTDVVVDGQAVAAMRLAGKPDPATYLEAARRLGVDPDRAAVVEDALAGVAAGRAGGFAVVVGVDRGGDPKALYSAGASVVIADVGDLEIAGPGPLADGWHVTYRPTGPAGEGMRETLLTLANGYVGTRGAATWAAADGVHYPGTYLAGLYDRLTSDVAGQRVERESIVNAPNWLALSFSVEGGLYLGGPGIELSGQELRLDLRAGIVRRRYQVTDPAGRRTTVTERRLVSMAEPHLMAVALEVVAENWSGTLTVRSGIDATCCADQTAEARRLSHCHLTLAASGEDDTGVAFLAARTPRSDVLVAEAVRTRIDGGTTPSSCRRGPSGVTQERSVPVAAGSRCHIEKVAAIYTSRDPAVSDPIQAARRAAGEAPAFPEIADAHRAAWAVLWTQAQAEIAATGRPAGVVNLHLFHLLQVASPHIKDIDCGLGARGLHGEGYEGHVFWDELFVTRMLGLRFPDIARASLDYRRLRLPAARRLARAAGEAGARFPWQSASDGDDVTPTILYNPRSRRWMADRSAAQRHVGLAVAYQYLRHLEVSDDPSFTPEAARVVFDVARHFAHLASYDEHLGRHHIDAVMGPDEFHDGYPWRAGPGVDDNAYTNILTAWLLTRAGELAEQLNREGRPHLLRSLQVDDADLALFDQVSRSLHVPFHDGVISQFAGYERLEPIDLDVYRDRYGNIGRLDLILEAEGDAVRRYQVAKQPDTLMLFYLFALPELRHTFDRLGYQLPERVVKDTIDYYGSRTTHGSTLSRVVHASVLARADRSASWRYFTEALAVDMADTQGGTTTEGIHLGAMAGTIDLLSRCYTGLETHNRKLILDPLLPDGLDRLRLTLTYKGQQLRVGVDHREITVSSTPGQAAPLQLEVAGQPVTLRPGGHIRRPLRHRAPSSADHPRSRPTQPHKEVAMATVTDPVCGMTIDTSAAAGNVTLDSATYYFCSPSCQQRFEAEPDTYTTGRR